MHIPIELLQTFSVLAETRNFTQTGKKIHRSQSAVSVQIKRLTEIVGKPLLEMEGKKVCLPPLGELVLEHAHKILNVHETAMATISQSKLKGRVRLGAPEDYCSIFLPQILSGFARDYNDIRVDVISRTSSQLHGALLHGELDLAICTELDVPGETIFKEPVVWIMKNGNCDILRKRSLPLAVYNDGCAYRKWATTTLDEMGRPYHIAYMSPSISGILASVRTGLAVAPVALSVVGQDDRIISPEDGLPALPTANVCLYGFGKLQNPLIESLAAHVREAFSARQNSARSESLKTLTDRKGHT